MTKCSVSNCQRIVKAHGLCCMHYKRMRNHGNTSLKRGGDPINRFFDKIKKTDSCWIWIGAQQKGSNYGHFWVNNKLIRPHRFSYEHFIGEIPEGFAIDHLCGTPLCVNPQHLEAVTWKENNLRSSSPSSKNAKKTHCLNGHSFNKENTYIYKGSRICKQCRREHMRNKRFKSHE